MKNFFKKLAFVLALAMVVTTVAPAASSVASAATSQITMKNGSKTSTVYVTKSYSLKLGKGVKATWTSSDKSVATVGKTGGVLKPVAPGKVTITAKSANTGKTYKKTFEVRLRADSVTPDVTEIALKKGETYNLKATQSPAETTDIIRFYSDNKEVATVGLTGGKVTAQGDGEATITVASLAGSSSKKTSTANRTATVKVYVGAVIKTAKQAAANKVEVAFATNVKDVVKKADFTIFANDAIKSSYAVKDIAFSADGKTVTVETFTNFKDAQSYTVKFGEKEVAFDATIGTVASIELSPLQVEEGVETVVKPVFKNANGVDISGTIANSAYTISTEVTSGYYQEDVVDGRKVLKMVILTKGQTAKVTVTLLPTEYDEYGAGKNEIKQEFTVTGVEKAAITVGAYDKFTVTGKSYGDVDWNNTTDKISVNDDAPMYLWVKAKKSNGNEISNNAGGFTYVSSNPNVLVVNDNVLTPVKEGPVYIVVKNDAEKIEWNIPVYVVAKRAATAISFKDNKAAVTVSNAAAINDKANFEVLVKDQFGSDMAVTNVSVDKIIDQPTGGNLVTAGQAFNNGGKVSISASGVKEGTYRFVLKAATKNGEKTIVATVVVQKPNGTAKTYDLVLTSDSVDTTVKDDFSGANISIGVSVVEKLGGVANGVVSATDVKVFKDGNEVKNVVSASASGTSIKVLSVAGTTVTKDLGAGTYKVTGKYNNLTFTKYFTVKDSQSAPAVGKIDKQTVEGTGKNAKAIAKEAILVKVKSDSAALDIENWVTKPEVKIDAAAVSAQTLFVESVTVNLTINGYTVPYTVNIGDVIYVK